jgi:hypothetical protein
LARRRARAGSGRPVGARRRRPRTEPHLPMSTPWCVAACFARGSEGALEAPFAQGEPIR